MDVLDIFIDLYTWFFGADAVPTANDDSVDRSQKPIG